MKPIEIKKETKKYYGIEYESILMAEGNQEPSSLGEVNDRQWWILRPTKKSEKMALAADPGILFMDTREMRGSRMQDKYNKIEIAAVTQINWVLGKYKWYRTKWLLKQIWFFVYVSGKTIPASILYRIKQLTGKQA